MNMITTDSNYIKYEKVFIPEIIKVHKDKLENYNFLKTISAGDGSGHILQGGNYFYMCLSKDDTIRIESKVNEPLGFKRSDINDLYLMASKFDKAYEVDKKRKYNTNSRKFKRIVTVPVWDTSLLWQDRMHNEYIINTVTGENIHLLDGRKHVFDKTGLSNHTLSIILTTGVESKNWCYKGQRLDGQSWDDFFKNKAKHYKSNDEYIHTIFKNDKSVIYFVNLKTTGIDLGVSAEYLRQALIDKKTKINNYEIIRLSPDEYRQRLYWQIQ